MTVVRRKEARRRQNIVRMPEVSFLCLDPFLSQCLIRLKRFDKWVSRGHKRTLSCLPHPLLRTLHLIHYPHPPPPPAVSSLPFWHFDLSTVCCEQTDLFGGDFLSLCWQTTDGQGGKRHGVDFGSLKLLRKKRGHDKHKKEQGLHMCVVRVCMEHTDVKMDKRSSVSFSPDF